MIVFVVFVASDISVLVVIGEAVTFEVVDFNPFSVFFKYGVEVDCVDIAVCAVVCFVVVIFVVAVVVDLGTVILVELCRRKPFNVVCVAAVIVVPDVR